MSIYRKSDSEKVGVVYKKLSSDEKTALYKGKLDLKEVSSIEEKLHQHNLNFSETTIETLKRCIDKEKAFCLESKVEEPVKYNILSGSDYKKYLIKAATVTSLYSERSEVNGLQIAIWYAESDRDVKGMQAAGSFAGANGNVKGVQVAGLFAAAYKNVLVEGADGDVKGVQAAGLVAAADGGVTGVQAAGLFAAANGDVKGVQTGLIAGANGDVKGVQAAGLVAIAGGNVKGVQAAGLIEGADGGVTGVQAAGLFAGANGDVKGVQAAGLIAIADENNGLQISPIAYSGKGKGRQIGLLLWGPGNKWYNPSVIYQKIDDDSEVPMFSLMPAIGRKIKEGLRHVTRRTKNKRIEKSLENKAIDRRIPPGYEQTRDMENVIQHAEEEMLNEIKKLRKKND